MAGLEINNSKHLSDVKLPEGVKPIAREDMTLGHHRAAVRLCRRTEGRCRCSGNRCCSASSRRGSSSGCCSPAAGDKQPADKAGRQEVSTPSTRRRGARPRHHRHVPPGRARQSRRPPRGRPAQYRLHGGRRDRQAPRLRAVAPPLSGCRDRRRRSAATKTLLLLPGTFMNESGRAVGEAANFYKIGLDDIAVVHDELDLAPGKLRIKSGGGVAGHNGLRSISAHVGNDYKRVRIGIGHPGDKNIVHSYVLSDFRQGRADRLGRDADRCGGRPRAAAGPRRGCEFAEQGASRAGGKGL